MSEIKPNIKEVLFLTLAYNRFYDLFDEIMDDCFWDKTEWERYSKINQIFQVYAELLNYEPIKHEIKKLKTNRPPMESEIGSELFKFIRNLISHFPLYSSWNEVWINKSLVNWHREGLTIDRFLAKYEGHEEIKYRFWESNNKTMTYLKISFPQRYQDDTKIYLKDILNEKDGVKFSCILMKNILNTQIMDK